MLKQITITNFKSYRHAVLPLAPLTVLIGANASGKSNAIEAMRLLSWLAQGHKLSTIKSGIQDSDQVVRGRVADLGYHGAPSFGFGCTTDLAEWNRLSIELSLRNDELHVSNESVTGWGSSVPLYEIVQTSTGLSSDVAVAYNIFAQGGKKPRITCSDQFAIFTQLDSEAGFQEKNKQSRRLIPRTVRRYQQWLEHILFLDPAPAKMRDYSFKSERQLQGDGANLSSVLYDLWHSKTDEEYPCREAILGFIRSLPEQDIETLEFLDGPRGEVMLQLIETFGDTPRAFDATLLSDGTLRVLAIASAMLSAPEESMVVIEEIDNGVHPSRARHLMEQIRQVAEQRSLHVLLTTHNPALLDALPDRAIPDVVFCYRSPDDGSSRMRRLQDLVEYPELIAQGSLGDLLTTGTLERFVKTQRGGNERKQQALTWLEEIRGQNVGAGHE
jgi:predicted ATPase